MSVSCASLSASLPPALKAFLLLHREQVSTPVGPSVPNPVCWFVHCVHHFDNFVHGQQQGHPSSDIELHPEAVCNAESEKAMFEHPPNDYKRSTIITYPVPAPSHASLLLLTGFVGIETFRPTPEGRQPSGRSQDNHVEFQIVVDGQVKFRQRKETSDWERLCILFVAGAHDVSDRGQAVV